MNLIEYIQQNFNTIYLSTFCKVFEFFGSLPFFVLLFAVFFLIYNKKFAYNYFLTYSSGFILGSLFLKNVVGRPRPYDVNPALQANHFAYSGSFPSAKSIIISSSAPYIFVSTNKKTNKLGKIGIIVLLTLVTIFVGFSNLYFANNYLLDVILGIFIGFLLSVLFLSLLKKININKKYMVIIYMPLLFILLFVFVLEWFTNNFTNFAIFEFIGISTSIILGTFLEEKYIKFKETKNNLFFTSFKFLITFIVLTAYYFLCTILPGIVIFSFIKYFIVGIIVTIILPICFKKLEKYFYIFSSNVKEENVVMSAVSVGVKNTKKLAKVIYNNLKPGDVVLLSGDLGAGKTELVRAILNYAGVKKEITSPTFTLVNEYNLPNNNYYHFDMYRLQDEEEVINIDFNELIDKKDAIKFIEWPEKVEKFLPEKYKKITIIKLGKKLRNIILEDYTNEQNINKIINSKINSNLNTLQNNFKQDGKESIK